MYYEFLFLVLFYYSTCIFIIWIKTKLTDNIAYFRTFKTIFETQLNYSFNETQLTKIRYNNLVKSSEQCIQNLELNSIIRKISKKKLLRK